MYSRISFLLKSKNLLHNGNNLQIKSIKNSHTWNYRKSGEKPKTEGIANILMGITWWWVLWHLITEPGHVFGEFSYPDSSKWTNQELGIPDN